MLHIFVFALFLVTVFEMVCIAFCLAGRRICRMKRKNRKNGKNRKSGWKI